MVRALSTAARAGRLTSREAELVLSIQRQAARPRWRPSPRQSAVIRRLHTVLAEVDAMLIDEHDTVDACPKRKAAADILKLEGIEK